MAKINRENPEVNDGNLTRRELLQYATCGTVVLAGFSGHAVLAVEHELPPVRAITHGPKYHWFGYYDKLQFDPTCRYVLGMEVDFEHRSPKPDDLIKIGMVDLKDNDRWIELGESRAWSWQQGCMLQWRPGSKTEILWNERQGGQFVCHILDVATGKKQTLLHPFYTISPDGRTAVAPDFRRIQDMRPGYGYAGLSDPYANELAPKDSGIFRLDLETGRRDLIISIADVAKIPSPHINTTGAKHYFNHLLFNPNGSRFIFLHRRLGPGLEGKARECSPLNLTARTFASWTATDEPHTLSGATSVISSPGPGTLHTETLFTSTKTVQIK